MAEAFRPDVLLRPDTLRVAATVDDAREIVDRLLSESDPDVIGGLMEHAVDKTDRAHAVVFELVRRIRWPEKGETGVQMASRMR